MEEDKTLSTLQLLSQSDDVIENQCLNHHLSMILCCNQKCKLKGPICYENQCQYSLLKHQKCKFISYKGTINGIRKKRQNPQPKFLNLLNQLRENLIQFCQEISEFQFSLEKFIDNYGVSQLQCYFLELFENCSFDQFNGKLNSDIRKSLLQKNKMNLEEIQVSIRKIQRFRNNFTRQMDFQSLWFSCYGTTPQVYKQKCSQRDFRDWSKKKNIHNIINYTAANRIKDLNILTINQIQIPQIIPQIRCLKKLEEIYLYDNGIQKISNLQSLVNLKIVRLDRNNIKKIQGLNTLKKLQKLDLNNNKIEKIQNLEGLVNLQHLSLHFNKIKKIQNLQCLQKLKSLYLTHNQIDFIQNLWKLKSIAQIRLYNNPAIKNYSDPNQDPGLINYLKDQKVAVYLKSYWE